MGIGEKMTCRLQFLFVKHSVFLSKSNYAVMVMQDPSRISRTYVRLFTSNLGGFLIFSFRVTFLSFVLNIPPSGICFFLQNRKFKVLFKETFS